MSLTQHGNRAGTVYSPRTTAPHELPHELPKQCNGRLKCVFSLTHFCFISHCWGTNLGGEMLVRIQERPSGTGTHDAEQYAHAKSRV